MADTEKKQVIIDVKVERDKEIERILDLMGGLTKEIWDCNKAIDKIKKEAKANGALTDENAKKLAKLTAERKTATNQLRSLSREEQNLVVANTAAKNSLNAMRAELNALKVQIADLDVDSPEFAKMAQHMNTITEKVSKAEQSYGVFSRNVGNYASGFSAVGFQVQQIARELPTLAVGLPQFFLALSNNIPMLTDAIRQEQAAVEADKEAGKEHMSVGKQLVKSIFSWQTAMVAAISVLTIWGDDILKWIGSLFKGKDALEDFRKSASEMVGAVAQERAELAALFNALSLAEQGTANYAAVRNTILDKYGDLLENEREEVKNLTNIADAYDVIAKKITGKAIVEGFSKQIEEQSKEFGEAYTKYFSDLLPDFVSKFGNEGISKLVDFLSLLQDGTTESVAQAKEIAKAFNTTTTQRVWSDDGTFSDEVRNINALLDNFGNGSKVDKIVKEFANLTDQIEATTEAQQTLLEGFGGVAPDTKNDGNGGEDDEYNRAKRSLELQQKLEAEKLKSQEQYQYNANLSAEENDALEFAHQQEHARKVFELEQQHNEQMLKLDEQYSKISAEDAKATRELYAQERTTFLNEQAAETSEFLRKQSEEMLKEADKLRKQVTKANEQTEIEATTKKWADYRTSLANNTEIDDIERADLTALSLEAEEAEKLAIKRKYAQAERKMRQEIGRQINEDLAERYADDLRQFSENEQEKLKLQIEMLEAEIQARKEKGLDTYEQEADLIHLKRALRTAEYEDNLAIAWKDADAQYDITRKMLEEELKLYEDNAAERARIEKQLYENEVDRTNKKLDALKTYTDQVGQLWENSNQLANSLYESQLATDKATNEKALAELEKRHEAGLVKTRDYNRQREQLEKDYAKKEAQIKRKQAIFDRGLALFNIAIQTYEGVTKAIAGMALNPVRGGILAGLITTSGAAQAAAVLAEPLPMAREGGLVVGPTHEQGGVVANLEGGEQIVAKNPVKVFPELLKLISYIGKHAQIPQSGYAFRSVADNATTAQAIGQQVQKAVKAESAAQAQLIGQQVGKVVAKELENLEVVTYVEAFKKKEKEYDKVVNSAKL